MRCIGGALRKMIIYYKLDRWLKLFIIFRQHNKYLIYVLCYGKTLSPYLCDEWIMYFLMCWLLRFWKIFIYENCNQKHCKEDGNIL